MSRQHTGQQGRGSRRSWRVLAGTLLAATLATLAVVVAGLLTRSTTTTQRPTDTPSPTRVTAEQRAQANQPRPEELLGGAAVRPYGSSTRAWRITRTDDNTAGSGLHDLCQEQRFADPRGYAALVRSLVAPGDRRRTAVQSVEVSRSPAAAVRAYRTALAWYAGCRAARVQLLDAHRVTGVGDGAQLLTLRVWRAPVTTLSVALARTGPVTTTVVVRTPGRTTPDARAMTRTLATAVSKLCVRSDARVCVRNPEPQAVPVPPSGEARGLLAAVDLPPVGDVTKPWAGTRPEPLTVDEKATSCDRARPFAAGAVRARVRTYLVPNAKLPTRFGLTESYARFRTDEAAGRYLAGVRRSVAGCEDRDLATQVGEERTVPGAPGSPGSRDGSAWDLTTEVSKDSVVRYRIGFVRVGRDVAQLTFTPGDEDDMTQAVFDALLVRAGNRLRELP